MRQKRRFLNDQEDTNILAGVANLFDVAIVMVVALLVTLVVSVPGMIDILSAETDFTMVVNPGQEDMRVITRIDEMVEIKQFTGKAAEGIGEHLGSTYQLKCGRIIYVPIAAE
ncbi:DUF2149 domain-containing protein [Thermodesulfovibrionales bacterium]|nr:DUF2149 domain-containing protein [Thermodesulfovibrionales bacterium]MCL0085006.1 DUF2149 domain-containing protein [Thermodesulfovibrionales bacterium]